MSSGCCLAPRCARSASFPARRTRSDLAGLDPLRVLVPGLDLRRLPADHEGRRARFAPHVTSIAAAALDTTTRHSSASCCSGATWSSMRPAPRRRWTGSRAACVPSSSATCPIPRTRAHPFCPWSTGCGWDCASRPGGRHLGGDDAVKIGEMNWSQVEAYLRDDDRARAAARQHRAARQPQPRRSTPS